MTANTETYHRFLSDYASAQASLRESGNPSIDNNLHDASDAYHRHGIFAERGIPKKINLPAKTRKLVRKTK